MRVPPVREQPRPTDGHPKGMSKFRPKTINKAVQGVWESQNAPGEPSAVDRLAAIEDPAGEAGQRCRTYDAQQARFAQTRAELEKLIAEDGAHMIEPGKPICKVAEIENEDGGITFGVAVVL
jgi:hypothetical protein